MRIHVFILIFIGCALVAWLVQETSKGTMNWYLTIAWTSYIPIALIVVMGALSSRSLKLSKFEGKVEQLLIVQIPTLARRDTFTALLRVVGTVVASAPKHFENFRVDVVVDEGSEAQQDLEMM